MSTKTKQRDGTRRNLIKDLPEQVMNLFPSSKPTTTKPCKAHLSSMLKLAGRHLSCLCRGFQWPIRRRKDLDDSAPKESLTKNHIHSEMTTQQVRIATFNAAMFSMAPVVPQSSQIELDIRGKASNDKPMKGILKQQKFSVSKRRVSINLPEDEISVERSKHKLQSMSYQEMSNGSSSSSSSSSCCYRSESWRFCERSVMDVLREVGAEIIGLQNVRAEEEKGMKPLSDLAEKLGMNYVFAESWAPDYGNAILSKWPIKRWRVQKIWDDSDFRNVLKATIDIPIVGEVNFHCTHLDHLDENWRMKQISSILESSDEPHILVGGLNSLDETDYSAERWNDIVKYYEEIGKLTPKFEVMKLLKGEKYSDAKNFAGECESIVVVAKGQDVQGTCKYGTRVDYILASPNSPYKFVSGSYGVISSKGTSDHHIVKVDIVIDKSNEDLNRGRQAKQRVVKINKDSSKGIWGNYS